MANRIEKFSGSFRFLSNFYPAPVSMRGEIYPTTEHAFQAAKTLDPAERKTIRSASTPGQAKRLGRTVALRSDWEEIKLDVMAACLRAKFSREPLRSRLLATDKATLVEGNEWNDTFWGVCRGVGENHLGRLLMEVREELRSA